jgi:hypothetical protein
VTEQQILVAQIAGNIVGHLIRPGIVVHVHAPDLAASFAHKAVVVAQAIVDEIQRVGPKEAPEVRKPPLNALIAGGRVTYSSLVFKCGCGQEWHVDRDIFPSE